MLRSKFGAIKCSLLFIIIYVINFFPLLLYIFKIYLYGLTLKFRLILLVIEVYEFNFWGYLIVYITFFIKMPIYIVHIWLPKAHVEAPVYGSIILAGVLLKIGSYGLIRMLEIFIKSRVKYTIIIWFLVLVLLVEY